MTIPLGLWEGSTENAAVATALLADLVERGLDITQGILVIRSEDNPASGLTLSPGLLEDPPGKRA